MTSIISLKPQEFQNKTQENCLNLIFLFVMTVICVIFVRYDHEISLVNYAKPNQEFNFVRYNREFVITVIVITEFDCSSFFPNHFLIIDFKYKCCPFWYIAMSPKNTTGREVV
jgi:hypothetical protein